MTINFTGLMTATGQIKVGTPGPAGFATSTWNSSDSTGMTLSNGDLTASFTSGTEPAGVRSTIPVSSSSSESRVYWELAYTSGSRSLQSGITQSGGSFADGPNPGVVVEHVNSVVIQNGTGVGRDVENVFQESIGGVYQYLLDMDQGAMFFGHNGQWSTDTQGIPTSTPPQVGNLLGALATGLSGTWYPTVLTTSTVGWVRTANFGATPFAFTAPPGIQATLF